MLFSISLSSEVSGDGNESEASFVILDHGEEETASNEIHTDQEILETETCDSTDVNVEQQTLENEVLEAIRQAGLDDKFWVKKIIDEFQVESLDQLKNVTKEQVINFLESTKDPIQAFLRQVFVNLLGIDISPLETKRSKDSSIKSTLLSDSSSEKDSTGQNELTEREMGVSATELVRFLENGVVCRGVDLYLNPHSDESVETKEKVIDVTEDLLFCDVQSIYPVHHRKFTSRAAMQTFLSDIGNYKSNSKTSMEKGISDIGLQDHTGCEVGEDSFVGYVHYKLVPVASVDLTADQIYLRTEVIESLQVVEQALKWSGYLPSCHFDGFFEKYGSHLGHGVVDFGDILISTAMCENFEEEVRSKVTDTVEEASKRGLLVETYEKVKLGEVLSAHDAFGEVPDLPSDLLRSITLTIKKIGSFPDADEKTALMKIAEDKTELRVINKCTSFIPIWEMLEKYQDRFQDHKEMVDTMKKEWTSRALQKQMDCFREDIQQWIEEYRCSNSDHIEKGLGRLTKIRHKYDKIDQHWAREVLYLRRVQRTLMQTTKFMMKDNGEMQPLRDEKTEETELIKNRMIASKLRCILHVEGGLQENRFPNLRLITETIEEIEGNREVEGFQIEYIEQLIEKWKDYKRDNNMNEKTSEIPMQKMQLKLEKTMKSMEQHPQKTFEYLIFIGVLQIFGFNTSMLRFGYQLSKSDLDIIFQSFEAHLNKFEKLHSEIEHQAYVFKLALYNMENKEESVLYLTKILARRLKKDLGQFCPEGNINHVKLHKKINEILPNSSQFDTESMAHSVQSQFQFLKKSQNSRLAQRDDGSPFDTQGADFLAKSEESIVEEMDMRKYYRGKLSLEEVITLKSEKVNKKPISLRELPWYFMKHLIGLDSDTRENCHVIYSPCNESDDDDDSDRDTGESNHTEDSEEDNSDIGDDEGIQRKKKKDGTITHVHPLDLQKIIMLCADDFLRQELIDKMIRCQYAVPFILPTTHNSASKNLILLWAMGSSVRTYYHQGQDVTQTLADIEAPLVTFMNIGTETSWKSKLLNKMLSPQQETFWHQALKGGNTTQQISQGMVEVAWWLPGRLGDNNFSCPITFTNFRGNAANSDTICGHLLASSSMTFVFVEGIDTILKEFLRNQRNLDRVVIVVLHKSKDGLKKDAKALREEFHLKRNQIICKREHDTNFDSVCTGIKTSIDNTLSADKQMISLTSLASIMRKNKNTMVDDRNCYQGQQAAKTILEDIDEYNRKRKLSAKSKILPFQSDQASKQKLAWLEKERYRQTNRSEEKSSEDYWYEKKAEKEELQLKELQEPVSDTFQYFLQCVLHLDEIDKKYFLQCLKLGLNERSEEILQPLYKKYEQYRLLKYTTEQKEERDKEMKELEKDLTRGSLGIEHFFREMGALYERILVLKEKLTCSSVRMEGLNELLEFLSEVQAKLWLGGSALEIMDGDTIHIPVEWLKAVMKKLDQKSDLKVFKLCAVGAQGSGKSTLLNTTLGLNFPVSSGRCTRGAYMQLVKIDEALKEKLKCDYIAVIDSEGLMSRMKIDDSEFDNELATFVIGLSDLTLVVNKDEGSEMKDVLPIAILVFLRMKPTGERKACHFVIEKRGAVGGLAQQGFEIDKFVSCLNEATLAAAKKADESDCNEFADVLKYDATKDNTYIPVLHDGSEMGRTNPNHMKATEMLMSSIINCGEDLLKKRNGFNFYTLSGTATRLEEIATAIKYEYLVLGFKSALAVKSYGILAKIFSDEGWKIKRRVWQMIREEKNRVVNEAVRSQLQTDNRSELQIDIRQQIEITGEKLIDRIQDGITKLRENISHYFECGGCQNCDRNVNHRDQLANYRKAFEEEATILQSRLKWEVHSSFFNSALKITAENSIDGEAKKIDDMVWKKVQEVIKTKISASLGKADIEREFDELWTNIEENFLKNIPRSQEDIDIKGAVNTTLNNLVKKDGDTYNIYLVPAHELRKKGKQKFKYNEDPTVFSVQQTEHMVLRGWFSSPTLFADHALGYALDEKDVSRLKDESDSIIEATKHHYDPCANPLGRQFYQFDVEELFHDVFRRISEIKDQRFKVTKEYKMDLLHFIKTKAVDGFTEMHMKYCREGSPESILKRKRKAYYQLFEVQMLKGDVAAAFCHTVLKGIILGNIDEELNPDELLQMLAEHPDGIFTDVKNLQAWIMKELMDSENHSNYLDYVSNWEIFVKRMIKIKATKYLTETSQLQNLQNRGRKKLEHILALARKAVNKVLENTEDRSFVDVLLCNLDTLTIQYDGIRGWIEALDEVPEKSQFASIIQQQLEGRLKSDILEVIDSWSISTKLQEMRFADFVFKAVVGCTARCPFCKTPCDEHTGDTHSARIHRPVGLGGYRYTATNILLSKGCSACVCSDTRFQHGDDKENYIPFKKYNTIYPEWCIKPDVNPDVGKYWKWVFANYNTQIAEYYSAKPADIPERWTNYTKEEVKEDLKYYLHPEMNNPNLSSPQGVSFFQRLKKKLTFSKVKEQEP